MSGEGFIEVSMPRALGLEEIPGIVADFRHAFTCAIEAGFDGVKLHGVHGYLLDAFLRDGTNHRTDAYGGSIENRARLLLEVTKACALAIGVDRLGVGISPVSTAADSRDSDPQALFDHVVDGLSRFRLAYVHVVEGETGGARDSIAFDYAQLRARFDGVWMVNNGYSRRMAMDAIASGRADLVSFGRPFIANPDLVERLREDAPLNAMMGQETLYGGGAHGYTDLPVPRPLRDAGIRCRSGLDAGGIQTTLATHEAAYRDVGAGGFGWMPCQRERTPECPSRPSRSSVLPVAAGSGGLISLGTTSVAFGILGPFVPVLPSSAAAAWTAPATRSVPSSGKASIRDLAITKCPVRGVVPPYVEIKRRKIHARLIIPWPCAGSTKPDPGIIKILPPMAAGHHGVTTCKNTRFAIRTQDQETS